MDQRDIDSFERMAEDLEIAQSKRYSKAKDKDAFWSYDEREIFEVIKSFRDISRTYDPNN